MVQNYIIKYMHTCIVNKIKCKIINIKRYLNKGFLTELKKWRMFKLD